jgi:hypothetical protein
VLTGTGTKEKNAVGVGQPFCVKVLFLNRNFGPLLPDLSSFLKNISVLDIYVELSHFYWLVTNSPKSVYRQDWASR